MLRDCRLKEKTKTPLVRATGAKPRARKSNNHRQTLGTRSHSSQRLCLPGAVLGVWAVRTSLQRRSPLESWRQWAEHSLEFAKEVFRPLYFSGGGQNEAAWEATKYPAWEYLKCFIRVELSKLALEKEMQFQFQYHLLIIHCVRHHAEHFADVMYLSHYRYPHFVLLTILDAGNEVQGK